MERIRLSSWAGSIGYSRASRVGRMVFVSGATVTNPDGTVVGVRDPEIQTQQVLENIRTVLKARGRRQEDVMQTRIGVTARAAGEGVGSVHGHVFGETLRVTTLLEGNKLASPEMLVEIATMAIGD